MTDNSVKLGPVPRFLAGLLGSIGAAALLILSAAYPFSTGWIVAVTLGPLVGWLLGSARTGNPRPWLAGLWFPIFYFTIAISIYISDKFYPDSSNALVGAFIIALIASLAVCVGIYQILGPRLNPDFVKGNDSDSPKLDQIEFRLPNDAVLKNFRIAGFSTIGSFLLMPLVGVSYFSDVFWWTVGFVLLATLIGYSFSKQYVYITLSSDGFAAGRNTGKTSSFAWRDDVLIEEKTMSGLPGILVRKQDAGFLKGMVRSVFVPQPILMQSEFQDAVKRYAPKAHPLRRIPRF